MYPVEIQTLKIKGLQINLRDSKATLRRIGRLKFTAENRFSAPLPCSYMLLSYIFAQAVMHSRIFGVEK